MSSTFFPLIELFNRGSPRDLEVADLTRYFNYNLDIPILVKRHFTHSLDIPITVKRHFTNSLDVAISVKRHFVFSTDFMYEVDDMPIGCVYQFAGPIANIPAGFLLCNGDSLLRASYPYLFTAISTVYGSVDGTHFNLPDLRDRMIIGAKQDDSGVPKTNITGSLLASGGSVTLTHADGAVARGTSGVTVSNHGNHTHPYGTIAVANHTSVSTKQGASAGNVVTTNTHTVSGSTGNPNATQTHTVVEPNAGGGHDHAFTQPSDHLAVVPPFLALAYIIKGV